MDRETLKTINSISKKINEMQRRLDIYFNEKCKENKILTNENLDCIFELAEVSQNYDECATEIENIVSDNSESILELSGYISSLEERLTALENN